MARITLLDGRQVWQACGEVCVLSYGAVKVAHYGELGAEIDAAALASLSAVERAGDQARHSK